MKCVLLVPAVFAGLLALAAPAHAQFPGQSVSRPAYTDEARQPFYEMRRVAYENGYREGVKAGEKDARKRTVFDYRNDRTWRRGDRGYHRTYGDRERYRLSFRAGFEAGYSDAYRRIAGIYRPGYGSGRAVPRNSRAPYPEYPPYPAGGRYQYPGQYGYISSPAIQTGLRDGYEKGREDARKRREYDPLRHRWYRSADRDYRREYGPKEQYQNLYRQSFREGYDRGYREWAYTSE